MLATIIYECDSYAKAVAILNDKELKDWVTFVDWTTNWVYISFGKGDFAQDAELGYVKSLSDN